MCTLKARDWVAMSMLHFGNNVIFFGFVRFLLSYFVCGHHNLSFNLASKTTYVSNTNSYFTSSKQLFKKISMHEEKFCRVSVPVHHQFLVGWWSVFEVVSLMIGQQQLLHFRNSNKLLTCCYGQNLVSFAWGRPSCLSAAPNALPRSLHWQARSFSK